MSDPHLSICGSHRVFPWVGWKLVASIDSKLAVWQKDDPIFVSLLIARLVRTTHGDPGQHFKDSLRQRLSETQRDQLANRFGQANRGVLRAEI